MAADASILADQFFKEAYVLPGVVGDGYGLLGPIGGRPEERNTIQAFLESQNKEAFDAYKSLFVKFKELVNTRKRVIAADAPAAPGAAAAPAPAINSHTKNELDKQYNKQLKELTDIIRPSEPLQKVIKGNVDIIARDALAGRAIGAGTEQIKRIFTEFLKIRVKGGLEKGKFLMNELFVEPAEAAIAPAAPALRKPNLHAIGLKTVLAAAAVDTETLSNFKRKYAYLKEVYPEEDKNFIHNVLSILEKENSYNLDLQYTLAKSVPEFISFTQAGRLVKDLKTYIQSGSPEAADAATLAATERETEAAFLTAFQEKERKRAALNQIDAQRARELNAARQAEPIAKAPGASPAAIQAFKAAVRSLRETNTRYNKASALLQKATAESRVAFNNHLNAQINNAPRPEVTAAINDGTIPRGTPIVTALKILALRGLDITDVPLLKEERSKIDKYVKAVAAVEGLRENKDDPVVYVQKRSVVNTLFTEKSFFGDGHLREGFIEEVETGENYKELLKEAIFGQELKEAVEAVEAGEVVEAEEGGEAEEAEEAEEAVKEARRGKVLYKEADNTYKLESLGFFDKLSGKALSKKELAEWWKKRGGKFNIGLTIPEPVITIFTETFHLKKKSKKTVRFTDNFLIEGVKGDAVAAVPEEAERLDDAAEEAGAAVEGAKPEEADGLEVTAKGFANNGIYDQEDGPPISSVDVKSGTMFEMYYLGWLDKTVPPIPLAAGGAAAEPAPAASNLATATASPAPAAAAAEPDAAAAAAAAEPDADVEDEAEEEEEEPVNYTPQQKKTITKMMKSLFSFVFSDIQVRDANKEKRFHDAYRIAYTVLEKHQKIPCKAENPALHKYFKKSLEYRKEIAIRELATTKMVGRDQLLGMQDHYKQLITGLSGLITFLDNAVEGQPCIVYGDTLSGGPVQVETGSIDTRYILQVFRNHIRMRRDGAPPPDKDVLMRELTLTGVPIEDVDAVYKQISDMLTDYAKLTKENPVLRDLVVLFSQIALYLQQLGDIRLELERLQRQIDKCTDKKEKERLQEALVTKEREFRVARDEVGLLEQRHREETEELEIRIAGLEEEKQRNLQRIDALNNELEECDRVRGEADAEVARLTARIDDLEVRLAETIRGRDIALARIPELDAELAALEAAKDAEIAGLTAQIAAVEAAKDAEIAALNAQIAAVEAAKDAELDGLRGQLAAVEAAKDAEIDGLRGQLAAVEAAKDAEIDGLRGQLAAAQAAAAGTEAKDAELGILRGQLAALQGERDAAARRIAELEAELLDAQKEDPRIADLQAERDAAARRIAELEAELLNARKEDPRIADLTARLAALQGESQAAARRIAQLEAELLDAQKEDPRIASLTVRLAGLQAEKDAAAGRIRELEADILDAQKEDPRIASLTARIAVLQAEKGAADGRIRDLEAEVGRLTAGAGTKDARIAQLEGELRECREALARANQTIAAQGARIRELEAEIARLRGENDALRRENKELEELLLRCAEEKRLIQEQLSALQQQQPPLPSGGGGGGGGAPEPPPSPAPSLGEGEEEQLPEQRFLTPEQRNEVFFFLNKVFINWVVQSGSILSRYTGVDRKDESIIDGIPVGSLLNSIKSILTDLRTKIDARKYGLVVLNDKKQHGNHIKDFREFMHNAYLIWTTGKDTGFNANRFRRLILILFKLAYMYISTKFCPDGDEYCSKNYILDIYRTMDGYNYDERAGYMVKDRYIEHLLQKVFNPNNLDPKKTENLINYLFLYTYLENTFAIDKDDNLFFMDKYNAHPHTPLNDPQYFYNIKWEDPKSLRYFIQYWNARLGRGAGAAAGGGPRRPQIGGARKTSVKSLSQGMLLLFLVELRKSKQLKSAKEVQELVNKAGKALDSIGQYELVLTILQGVMEHTNTPIQDGYTYVGLSSMKKEKANALIESYNEVFDKSDSQMFKSIGTPGSFHASAPEEFEEVLGKGPFCLVLAEGKGESKEETPLHGVSDEYEVVLEEKERKVLEDNGGIPLGGVIFLYLVCLNELYCDSSDEECIRPTI